MKPVMKPFRLGKLTNTKKHPLKLTALLYLKEALLAEQYEDCREIVATALEFGALALEVQYLLEDPRRIPRG